MACIKHATVITNVASIQAAENDMVDKKIQSPCPLPLPLPLSYRISKPQQFSMQTPHQPVKNRQFLHGNFFCLPLCMSQILSGVNKKFLFHSPIPEFQPTSQQAIHTTSPARQTLIFVATSLHRLKTATLPILQMLAAYIHQALQRTRIAITAILSRRTSRRQLVKMGGLAL